VFCYAKAPRKAVLVPIACVSFGVFDWWGCVIGDRRRSKRSFSRTRYQAGAW